jgi:hypothetical protein
VTNELASHITLYHHSKHHIQKEQKHSKNPYIIEQRKSERINTETLNNLAPITFFPNDPTPFPILNLSYQGLIQVDKFFPSSKLCHCCGYKKEDLALHERIWTCPVCGTVHDRDINASINLYLVGLERPDVKPVERELPSVKQEAPPVE